jgi:hypothetical protein
MKKIFGLFVALILIMVGVHAENTTYPGDVNQFVGLLQGNPEQLQAIGTDASAIWHTAELVAVNEAQDACQISIDGNEAIEIESGKDSVEIQGVKLDEGFEKITLSAFVDTIDNETGCMIWLTEIKSPEPMLISEQVSTTETTNETNGDITPAKEQADIDREVTTMTDVPGVEVRLTQLQERLERAIAHGETIIAEVSASGNDTTALQAALDGLKTLKDEVAALDTTGDISEVTATYVAIKKEAIDAVKAFRDEARKLVKEDRKTKLKEKMKAAEDKLKVIRDKIKNLTHKFNAEVAAKIFMELGKSNPDLIAKIQSGNATLDEVKAAIKSTYNSLTPAKKNEAKQKIKEDKTEANVKKLAAFEKVNATIAKRINRIEANNRTKFAQELGKVQTNLENKENKTNSRGGKNE